MSYNISNVNDPEIATRVISALRECCSACISLTDGNDSGFNFSTMDNDCIGAIVKNYMYNIDTDSDSVDDMLLDVAYMCESLSQYLYGVMTFNRENYNILKSEYLREFKKVKVSSEYGTKGGDDHETT